MHPIIFQPAFEGNRASAWVFEADGLLSVVFLRSETLRLAEYRLPLCLVGVMEL